MNVNTALDRVIPVPRLVEVDHVDLAVSPRRAWEEIRHGDLGDAPLARALLLVRPLPDRIAHRSSGAARELRVDALRSSPQSPGFQILTDDGASELVVGAIGLLGVKSRVESTASSRPLRNLARRRRARAS